MHRRSFLKTGVVVGLAGMRGLRGFPHQDKPSDTGLAIRLNSNENPRGPSPKAREAVMRSLADAGRYPFKSVDALSDALARRHGVETSQIVLGNGSSEVLQMAVQSQAAAGTRLVQGAPTFESPADGAVVAGLSVERVPLTPDFSLDIEKMRQCAESQAGPVIIYLCNPNNPTGTLCDRKEVEDWLDSADSKTFFLLDEAYFDYVDGSKRWTGIPRTAQWRNLIVTRTFSKVFGMAGMRLGYGIAHTETADRIRAWASDINTNSLAVAAGLASLEDPEYPHASVAINLEAKEILCSTLRELGLPWIATETNFLMHRIPGDLKQYTERMKESGILVGRAFPPLLDHSRISIGLPEEMEKVAATLRDFRSRGWV